MTLQQWLETWWMSGIVLPLFFAVAVGGVVSLWAGFVTADLIEFRRITREAARAMWSVIYVKPSGIDDYMRIHDFAILLRDLGQITRGDELDEMSKEFLYARQRLKIAERSELHRGQVCPPDFFKDAQTLHDMVHIVRTMRPNYLQLFFSRLEVIWDYREEKNRSREL